MSVNKVIWHSSPKKILRYVQNFFELTSNLSCVWFNIKYLVIVKYNQHKFKLYLGSHQIKCLITFLKNAMGKVFSIIFSSSENIYIYIYIYIKIMQILVLKKKIMIGDRRWLLATGDRGH